MSGTRARLLQAAADVVRQQGVAAASARTIAAQAQVNQALIFYHFGTVSQLLEAACRQAADEAADFYRDRLARVTTFPELLQLGRELHERERAAGNVAMMAQLMSGAVSDPLLARAAAYAMSRWAAEIETVVARVLSGSPLGELADPAGLARAISASFIGLELYEGVDSGGAAQALDALERLGMLAEVAGNLGPAARRALRSKLKGAAPAGPRPRRARTAAEP